MAERGKEMEPSEEIVRLLALQIRLGLNNQTQAILELDRAGFGPTRIGQLLGTTAATAKTTIARSKKPRAKSKTKAKATSDG